MAAIKKKNKAERVLRRTIETSKNDKSDKDKSKKEGSVVGRTNSPEAPDWEITAASTLQD